MFYLSQLMSEIHNTGEHTFSADLGENPLLGQLLLAHDLFLDMWLISPNSGSIFAWPFPHPSCLFSLSLSLCHWIWDQPR
jgi:hypothetical protein